MKSAETCSCSLCNKLYTYLYHHIVVLDKYIHSILVYYKHNGDDELYEYGVLLRRHFSILELSWWKKLRRFYIDVYMKSHIV